MRMHIAKDELATPLVLRALARHLSLINQRFQKITNVPS